MTSKTNTMLTKAGKIRKRKPGAGRPALGKPPLVSLNMRVRQEVSDKFRWSAQVNGMSLPKMLEALVFPQQ